MPTRSDSGDNLLAELEQHNAVLLRLALAQHRPDLSFKQTLESFAEEVAAYLHVERIGIWVFNQYKSVRIYRPAKRSFEATLCVL